MAINMLHVPGVPTSNELKKLTSMNWIKNSGVTCEDVNLAKSVLGPDIASIKQRKNDTKEYKQAIARRYIYTKSTNYE